MIVALWQKLTARRYVRVLETEVERLRAENRALMNSILGIAGVPPIQVTTGSSGRETVQAVEAKRQTYSKDTYSFACGPGCAKSGATRRRSWYQINKALEFEYGRKPENNSANGVALPVARKER